MLCSCFGGKHAEDARSAPDVQDSLSPEKVAVIDDRGAIRSRSDRILEHLLVNR